MTEVNTKSMTDADHDSKKVMLRAERGDTISVKSIENKFIDQDVPNELEVTQRQRVYYGPRLSVDSSDEAWQITCPGPKSGLILWKAVTDEDNFIKEWKKAAEVQAKVEDCGSYDLCSICGQPMKTLEHERDSATGMCNRNDQR